MLADQPPAAAWLQVDVVGRNELGRSVGNGAIRQGAAARLMRDDAVRRLAIPCRHPPFRSGSLDQAQPCFGTRLAQTVKTAAQRSRAAGDLLADDTSEPLQRPERHAA